MVRNLIHVLKSKTQLILNNKQDLVHHGKCPANNGNNDYVGKTGWRISERIVNHSSFRNNTLERKISAAFWIKDLIPTHCTKNEVFH